MKLWSLPSGSAMVIAATLLLGMCGAARADMTVGVILSTTGQAASLGILEKNGVGLAASTGNAKVKYLYVDDATDPAETVKAARRLITEEKVDAIIGTTGTPGALALSAVAAEGTTVVVSMAPANILVEPVDAQRRWIYKTTTNDDHEVRPMFAHMKATGVHTLGFIGFADSYGEQWVRMARRMAPENQVQIVAEERFARTDPSVASQVLKIVGKSPDAVLIAGSSAAAATPLLELRKRGYRGKIYVTLGATFGDFLRVAGSDAEGIYAPFAAVMGVAQIPDAAPDKRSAQAFVQAYDAKFGANSSNIFSAGAWDAQRLLEQAAGVAQKTASPGTPEFRAALRSALEGIKGFPGARGIYTLSATDHVGLDASALRLGRYEKGRWVVVEK